MAGRDTRRWLVAATAVAALAVSCATAPAAVLPPGFTDEPVLSAGGPTAIAFTPDGRLLVTTQAGALRVHTPAGGLLATPALNLAGKLCANSERGLLGVAVDPAFATNRFVYLYYTFNKFANACPTGSSTTPVNRVSRFVLGDSNTVDPATETVLIDNIPSFAGNHNAGDLQFGRDGNLYVSVGDGGCDYAGNSGCAGSNDAARDEHVLLGKILRITPSGGIPADNPFTGAGTARCNTGAATAGLRCQETFAWGLRNPFRIAFDPTAAGTRFHINDVGQAAWEEIDLGAAGADFGWNVREGHCVTGSTTDCGTPPAGMTNPIFDYGRADGCTSITGGAFVPAGNWPPAYAGTYLFGDFVCGRIFRLVPDGAGGFDRITFADGLGAGSAVHLAFGPHATGAALYYTTFAGGGAVRRIAFVAGTGVPAPPPPGSPPPGIPGATTPGAPASQPSRCAQRTPVRRVEARPVRETRSRATVIARTGRRLGARAGTSYRVILVRRCVVVATGSARDRRLALRVRSTATQQIVRDGRRTTVRTYPRLRGRYVLRPAAEGPRIAFTTLTFRRAAR